MMLMNLLKPVVVFVVLSQPTPFDNFAIEETMTTITPAQIEMQLYSLRTALECA